MIEIRANNILNKIVIINTSNEQQINELKEILKLLPREQQVEMLNYLISGI